LITLREEWLEVLGEKEDSVVRWLLATDEGLVFSFALPKPAPATPPLAPTRAA
jgi:hypothetical protein